MTPEMVTVSNRPSFVHEPRAYTCRAHGPWTWTWTITNRSQTRPAPRGGDTPTTHHANDKTESEEVNAYRRRRTKPGTLGGSNRMLSARDVAAILAVPERTVRDKWREWGLPAYRIGKHLRWRERDVHAWIDRQAA